MHEQAIGFCEGPDRSAGVPFGLYFLEEPCWPESIEGLAAINVAVTTPIATGERRTLSPRHSSLPSWRI